MTNDPGDRPDDEPTNPFKGTPFEQIFNAFGGGVGGAGAGPAAAGMPDLSRADEPDAGDDGAARGLGELEPGQGRRPADRRRSSPTRRPPTGSAPRSPTRCGSPTTGSTPPPSCPPASAPTAAWSRAEWVEQTIDGVAAARRAGRRARRLRDGQRAAAGGAGDGRPADRHPRPGRRRDVRQPGRPGRSAGSPARCSPPPTSGCRSVPSGTAALLPHERDGLRRRARRVRPTTCCSTSRCARPPTSGCSRTCPWLRGHLLAAVEDYGRGTTIDMSKIESSMRDIDPTNPAAIQQALEGGLFEPEKTPAQQAALTRLETALALVEGWVDEVVGQATEHPDAGRRPGCRRRSAAAVPPAARPSRRSPRWSASSCGPRRLRDASALWGSLRSRKGQRGPRRRLVAPRPAAHRGRPRRPAGLPARACRASESLTDAEFDAALADLLDNEDGGDEPGRTPTRRAVTAPRLHDDALATLRAGPRPTPRRSGCARSTSTTCDAHPDGMPPRLPPGPRHRRGAGALRRPRQVLLTLHAKARRWFHLGGHCEPDDPTLAGAALREARRGVRRRRAACWTRCRCTSTRTRWRSAARTSRCDHLDVRFLAVAPAEGGQPDVSEESIDVRWWPVDALPDRGGRAARDGRRAALGAGLRRVVGRHLSRALVGAVRRVGLDAELGGGGDALEEALGPLGLGVAVDPRPELRGVAGLDEVGELVDEHVVDDPRRHALQPGATAGSTGRSGCSCPSGCSGCRPSGRPAARRAPSRYFALSPAARLARRGVAGAAAPLGPLEPGQHGGHPLLLLGAGEPGRQEHHDLVVLAVGGDRAAALAGPAHLDDGAPSVLEVRARRPCDGGYPLAHASSRSTGQVVTIRSSGTPSRCARSAP